MEGRLYKSRGGWERVGRCSIYFMWIGLLHILSKKRTRKHILESLPKLSRFISKLVYQRHITIQQGNEYRTSIRFPYRFHSMSIANLKVTHDTSAPRPKTARPVTMFSEKSRIIKTTPRNVFAS